MLMHMSKWSVLYTTFRQTEQTIQGNKTFVNYAHTMVFYLFSQSDTACTVTILCIIPI